MEAYVIVYDGMDEPIKVSVDKMKTSQLRKSTITMLCDTCGNSEDITYCEYEKLTDKEVVDCSKCRVDKTKKRHYVPYGIGQFFRAAIRQWVEDSLEHHNRTCVITGKPAKVIHHITSFSAIVVETLKCMNMTFEQCYDADEETCKKLSEKCLELHYKHECGACFTKPVHQLFHHCYGNIDNDKEQYDEFVKRISEGKIDLLEWLNRYDENDRL